MALLHKQLLNDDELVGAYDFSSIEIDESRGNHFHSYFDESVVVKAPPAKSKKMVAERDYFDESAEEEEEIRSPSSAVEASYHNDGVEEEESAIPKQKSLLDDDDDLKFDHALCVVERDSGLLSFMKSWRTDVQVPYEHCSGQGEDAIIFKKTYTKACKGSKSAQCELGIMYYYANHGVMHSTKSAIYWLKLAGNRGYRLAMINLGIIYYFKEEHDEAHEWFLKAAEDGCPWGMFHLGVMYLNGEGQYHNLFEAFAWFKKSGKRGNSLAQNNVGSMYAEGAGCVKNTKKSMKWFEKASDGSAYAMHNLGMMYEKGVFVHRDSYEASRYFGMSRSGNSGYNNYGPSISGNLHKKSLRDGSFLMITTHNF